MEKLKAQGEGPGKNGPTPFCSPSPAKRGKGKGGDGCSQCPRLSPWANLCRPPRRALEFLHF